MKNYSNDGYENKTFNRVISVWSEVKDGICSTGMCFWCWLWLLHKCWKILEARTGMLWCLLRQN